MEPEGSVNINNEVIKAIVGKCCLEVPGVSSLSGGTIYQNLVSWGAQSDTKGITIEKSEDDNIARIDVNVTVLSGQPIPIVAKNLQSSVKETVESMTGREVGEIYVHIIDIADKPVPGSDLDSEQEPESPPKKGSA